MSAHIDLYPVSTLRKRVCLSDAGVRMHACKHMATRNLTLLHIQMPRNYIKNRNFDEFLLFFSTYYFVKSGCVLYMDKTNCLRI